jgi:2-C-methyl-D-erythritol 4-phosphate cytidylyltransferase/2-C-methyl-D-erythritol 2,4-cyclodiphosphate synthase
MRRSHREAGAHLSVHGGSGAATGRVGVVVVAAGASTRFGADKLAQRLAGRTVLEHAVAALGAALPGAPIVLVVRADAVAATQAQWSGRGVRVVAGGARRQDSVRHGVEALGLADDAVVVIHDGARPYVPAADVAAVVAAAAADGAALLVGPVVDTVKRVRRDRTVRGTVKRERLARALTPQAFRLGVLRAAWRAAAGGEWTDEAGLVEASGATVRAVPGDPRNLKVTGPEDLAVLSGVFPRECRTGQGVDVHSFAAGRRLVLCGVEIPGGPGLAGHSDADVALHAVTDAVLGACGAGDIGEHFPPADERWRDAESGQFVRHAVELAGRDGWRVVHCDVTLLAERPRIAPHRAAMRARLAGLLGVDIDRASVKATTSEGLGFVGRGEGIVALAVVTLERS